MWSFISIVLWTVGFYFLIKKAFLKEEFLISKVEFSEETVSNYEDIELFDFLSKALQGKNYYEFQYFLKGSLLSQAQKITPFLENIDYQLMTGNTLGLDLQFQEPEFRLQIGDKKYGVRETTIEPLLDTMQLGNEKFILYTPQYLSGTTSLSGFFYQISFLDLKGIIDYIQEEMPTMSQLMYFVGSKRFVIFTENQQEIYFDFTSKNDFLKQFEKYHLLQQYYPDKEALQVIDLGALDDTKVIVRKKS